MLHNESRQAIDVVGAGIAGLTTAILLAREGRQVVVHEAQSNVGGRFGCDLQGLENWSTKQNVLEWMASLGLTTDFTHSPSFSGYAFDAWDNGYRLESDKPLFYTVERGPGHSTLDRALLSQALKESVEIRFNKRVKTLTQPGVLATGPKSADAIAVGYHFDTDSDNGFWVVLNDDLAPKGYAYLLVMNGKGTLKTCMFSDFKNEKQYLRRTVETFERLVGIRMNNPVYHGGVGNFDIPKDGTSGKHLVVGEQAGFQDFLWGFGMRVAMESGVLAARSVIEGRDYNALWHQHLSSVLRNSMINRVIFNSLGNRGYRWFLRRRQHHGWNIYRMLSALYRPSIIKQLLYPWAQYRFSSHRKDYACHFDDCACVWCRHAKPERLRHHRLKVVP